jgi:hypothetical protein
MPNNLEAKGQRIMEDAIIKAPMERIRSLEEEYPELAPEPDTLDSLPVEFVDTPVVFAEIQCFKFGKTYHVIDRRHRTLTKVGKPPEGMSEYPAGTRAASTLTLLKASPLQLPYFRYLIGSVIVILRDDSISFEPCHSIRRKAQLKKQRDKIKGKRNAR